MNAATEKTLLQIAIVNIEHGEPAEIAPTQAPEQIGTLRALAYIERLPEHDGQRFPQYRLTRHGFTEAQRLADIERQKLEIRLDTITALIDGMAYRADEWPE